MKPAAGFDHPSNPWNERAFYRKERFHEVASDQTPVSLCQKFNPIGAQGHGVKENLQAEAYPENTQPSRGLRSQKETRRNRVAQVGHGSGMRRLRRAKIKIVGKQNTIRLFPPKTELGRRWQINGTENSSNLVCRGVVLPDRKCQHLHHHGPERVVFCFGHLV